MVTKSKDVTPLAIQNLKEFIIFFNIKPLKTISSVIPTNSTVFSNSLNPIRKSILLCKTVKFNIIM